jgi:HK97 family phage portal protein
VTVLGRLLRSVENPRLPLTSETVAEWFDGDYRNDSGVKVTETTALGMPAVWRAVALISGTGASLPLKSYRKPTRARVMVRLLENPHQTMTQFEFWELAYLHVLLWGNFYARKVRNAAGVIQWLEPIAPSSVRVGRVKPDADFPEGKIFEVQMLDGSREAFSPYDVFHIPGMGYDGLVGIAPISVARQSIGLGLAAEAYGAKLFGSGSLMSGILQSDQVLDDTTAKALKKRWHQSVGRGVSRAHEIAVLGAGATFQPVTMPNNDAQFIESRRFQIAEIARWFGLPGHMLNDTEKSTTFGAGIEHMSIGMVVFTLRPTWLTRFEQRITRELVPGPTTYAEYAVEGLLRGDSAARANFYRVMREVGALSANDIRAMENMPPIDGGDVYLQPANLVPLGTPPPEPEDGPDADEDEA